MRTSKEKAAEERAIEQQKAHEEYEAKNARIK